MANSAKAIVSSFDAQNGLIHSDQLSSENDTEVQTVYRLLDKLRTKFIQARLSGMMALSLPIRGKHLYSSSISRLRLGRTDGIDSSEAIVSTTAVCVPLPQALPLDKSVR